MSLLHTVLTSHLATMRAPVGGPWPDGAVLTPDDVLVDGVSLAATAQVAATPVVLLGRRAVPAAGHHTTSTLLRSVLVVRVDATVPRLRGLPRQVWVDADLSGCSPILSEVRLVGRASQARRVRFVVRPEHADAHHDLARLPEDVHERDVLVIPCLGAISPADIAL
ncbi:conserved hypothetical protein [Beutenbergia cavernae DSM 12333]|uniref:Uncharacterized protein n=1 Tax=Beutenbergia cavernae (strain ATCC BAA-8 / DSM 12333 / CCUG 43141 / JCM 11478 / NBRC 16432 / NCIMB 13614 / HKI 0122) TaxID=471853 RepID=C5C6J2_BEUC1|nr:hypothetical protein [Beutenbergia cavernae]ACQ80398.1 conserved hypothetical protein [Beutenbergia cavernae DSM 12333]